MIITLYDFDDLDALIWAKERSSLPADHPQHLSREARDVIFSRALTRMERQCDAMIAAVLSELGRDPPPPSFWRKQDVDLAAIFHKLPGVQNIHARNSFEAEASVSLRQWHDLNEATDWCAGHWEERRLHFRRLLDVEAETAEFEFPDQTHAVNFKMRFG